MGRLSPLDASWLTLESPEKPMHVATLAIFSLPEDAPRNFMQQLYKRFRTLDGIARPFNQKLSAPNATFPSWVEDRDIDIDYHVRLSALPKPGGEKELMILISRLHGSLLDRTRPLWECHLIEGLKGRRFAVYTKMHHSMIDGVAGMKLVQASFSTDPKVEVKPPFEKGARPEKPRNSTVSQTSDVMRGALTQTMAQLKTLPGLARTFNSMRKSLGNRSGGKGVVPYQAPRTPLNMPISGQRLFVVKSFQLDDIKAIGKATGSTVNDVVLALCAGCLRRYLLEHETLTEIPLIADVPVSVRPEGSEGGNAISVILASLATNVEDPLQRLKVIRESMQAGKQQLQQMSHTEINNYTMLVMLPYTIGQLIGTAGKVRPMFNVVISNVPGPKQPLYFNGARMEALYPVSLLFNGQAFNITTTSYVDTLDFGFTACRRTMPKVTQLPRYISEAMKELQQAIDKA